MTNLLPGIIRQEIECSRLQVLAALIPALIIMFCIEPNPL